MRGGSNGLILAAIVCISILGGMCFGVFSANEGRKGRRIAEKGPPKNRRKTSDSVLLALGLFAVGFIAAMTFIFCVKGAVPDTLIQYTLGAGGVEALLLAGIKISKILGPPREPGGAGRVGRGEARERTEFSAEPETELSGPCDDETGDKPGESENTYEQD